MESCPRRKGNVPGSHRETYWIMPQSAGPLSQVSQGIPKSAVVFRLLRSDWFGTDPFLTDAHLSLSSRL